MADVLSFPQGAGSVRDEVPDAAAREAALDVTRSFVVEAPAGSGKTGLLLQRYLKLLATVDDPAQVLAITFTRKATAELEKRVVDQLAASRSGTSVEGSFEARTRTLAEAALARDAQMGWGLLEDPAKLRIRTIDAVCAELTRTLPVLNGLGPGPTPADDPSDLFDEAAGRTLAQLGGSDAALNEALEMVLLHRDANLAQCRGLIAAMLRQRDQWAQLIPLDPAHLNDAYLDGQVLPRLERALERAICRGLTQLVRALPRRMLDELCGLAAEMATLDGYKGDASPLAICAGNGSIPEEQEAHLEHWHALIHLLLTKDVAFRKGGGLSANNLKFAITPEYRRRLAALLDEIQAQEDGGEAILEALCAARALPAASYPPEQWLVMKALFRTLTRGLAELQLVFAERNRCDFAEIALRAKAALQASGGADGVAENDAAIPRLQHLLVDEMQDTSTAQYELIQLMTQHWDGHSQTVFVVGDPKQSIYLFRQARVERFLETMRTGVLGDLPLTALRLTANFRSQEGLVEGFNRDFGVIFSRAGQGDAAGIAYEPVQATRARASEAIAWHVDPVEADSGVDATVQAKLHAERIRDIIVEFRGRALPAGRTEPWRIAILVQARNHLLPIVPVLREAGIAYRAVKVEPLAERQEILDLLALTRALLHPADRIAWLACLRAPWCGLGLGDLHLLAGADDAALARRTVLELMENRAKMLSGVGLARVGAFGAVMSSALSQRGRMPLAELVQRTWAALGANRVMGAEEMLNAGQYFALLEQAEEDGNAGALDVEVLRHRLTQLYAAPNPESGAVELMTIHTAKGLEWDLVVVPGMERAGAANQYKLLNWLETGASDGEEIAPGILAPIKEKGGAAGRLLGWMRSVDTAREAAERKRLFYVAATRAREALHLFAAPRRRTDGTISVGTRNMLVAAKRAAERHFPEQRFAGASSEKLVQFPAVQGLALAASGVVAARMIQRIPLDALALPARSEAAEILTTIQHTRPEASFSTRTLGNALHDFLEVAARRMSAGMSAAELLAELPGWSRRIGPVLRSAGLSRADTVRHGATVLRALTRTLESAEGQWLLAAHEGAASELALMASDDGGVRGIRIDRTFLAGAATLSVGTSHRWIVDFKTATHTGPNLEAWIEEQREIYRPQLEGYARALPGLPVRVGLFFPLLARLVWWEG